jgi:hypothetical protein
MAIIELGIFQKISGNVISSKIPKQIVPFGRAYFVARAFQ